MVDNKLVTVLKAAKNQVLDLTCIASRIFKVFFFFFFFFFLVLKVSVIFWTINVSSR